MSEQDTKSANPRASDIRGLSVAQLKRRAFFDALIIIAATGLLAIPSQNAASGLKLGIATVAVGILLFLVRRGNDVSRMARTNRLRDAAVEGRGVSLEQWHNGADVTPWDARR